jgi:pimeloyl-ACP methyl ester carboxylesterase
MTKHTTSGNAVHYHTVDIDGVKIFYRAAGLEGAPVILLLHGYPTSSFMFRNLIPILAGKPPNSRLISEKSSPGYWRPGGTGTPIFCLPARKHIKGITPGQRLNFMIPGTLRWKHMWRRSGRIYWNFWAKRKLFRDLFIAS